MIFAAIGEAGRRASPPLQREIRLQLALRDWNAHRLDDAETRLAKLVSEHPRDTRARLALVGVYREQGRITEAEEALQRAVEMGLRTREAWREHILIRSASDFSGVENSLRR